VKITIESTTRTVNCDGVDCRVWEGTTERGAKVVALIPRIAALDTGDLSNFEEDLTEMKPPSNLAMQVFPLRMVL
jgi:hypothetical protein